MGIVDKEKVINGEKVKKGDIIIGLPSSGIHSNGYSLVRKLFFEVNDYKTDSTFPELSKTLGEELLTPTRIYVKTILKLLKQYEIKGIAHITGGGFIENIPRTIPQGLKGRIELDSWPVLPIFKLMEELGGLDEQVLFNTFNMGIGLALIVDKTDARSILDALENMGEKAYIMGDIIAGEGGLVLCKK